MNAITHHIAARPKRRIAKSLYWQGWTIGQIADELEEKPTTVRSWKKRDAWNVASPIAIMNDALEQRFSMLVLKPKKTSGDLKEIDLLGRQAERLARVKKYSESGNEADLNPNVKNRNTPEAKEKAKTKKNHITADMLEKLKSDLEDALYAHQEDWYASTSLRTRFIIKSRQIGATWYFARERFLRGMETGNNQIFISASRAQAHIFRNYIVQWVEQVCGVKLSGDPITVQRSDDDGEILPSFNLYFLGTNYRTAQGYSGDVIIDEGFWIYGFKQLYKVASAMATHKQFTRTIFSTPSVSNHEAYPMWDGTQYNDRRPKADKVPIKIDHQTLENGKLGADGIWRQIVTLEQAVERGFDLIDIDQIRDENSLEQYDNLYGCNFLDSSQSSFKFETLKNCMVDSWEVWRDFQYYDLRPFGNKQVWIGYDPNASANGDDAALVIIAPPDQAGGKFRILEKIRTKGQDFEAQAATIEKLCAKYNVTHIAIDANGVGVAVYNLVQKFFPAVTKVGYSPHEKSTMVHKAQNILSKGRLEFDAGWRDVVNSFLAIRPDVTSSGRQITYRAKRAEGQGHADIAWAIMHVLINEPLDASSVGGQKTTVTVMD